MTTVYTSTGGPTTRFTSSTHKIVVHKIAFYQRFNDKVDLTSRTGIENECSIVTLFSDSYNGDGTAATSQAILTCSMLTATYYYWYY